MKNLWFILWGLVTFRLHKKGNAAGLVLQAFTENDTGNAALQQYHILRAGGQQVYVLCAFNNAPLGQKVADYRDVYIFNNDPQILAKFCAKQKIGSLYYYDSSVMQNAAKKFGLAVHAQPPIEEA